MMDYLNVRNAKVTRKPSKRKPHCLDTGRSFFRKFWEDVKAIFQMGVCRMHSSSVVEQPPVKRMVAGSSPACAAKGSPAMRRWSNGKRSALPVARHAIQPFSRSRPERMRG